MVPAVNRAQSDRYAAFVADAVEGIHRGQHIRQGPLQNLRYGSPGRVRLVQSIDPSCANRNNLVLGRFPVGGWWL
jgi:hypothetical protein